MVTKRVKRKERVNAGSIDVVIEYDVEVNITNQRFDIVAPSANSDGNDTTRRPVHLPPWLVFVLGLMIMIVIFYAGYSVYNRFFTEKPTTPTTIVTPAPTNDPDEVRN